MIDDDESVRHGLMWTLNSDYRVLEAAGRTEVLKLLRQESVDVVVTDLHLPPRLEDISEGLAIIEAARANDPPAQVVVITGSGEKTQPAKQLSVALTASSKSRWIAPRCFTL